MGYSIRADGETVGIIVVETIIATVTWKWQLFTHILSIILYSIIQLFYYVVIYSKYTFICMQVINHLTHFYTMILGLLVFLCFHLILL